jgi:serine/threonine-protein kinase
MQRNLEGDLDRVVLMALRKEAERRYATVEMFAEDIQRFLGDLPVRAQVDSLRYRTRKFVQRNRPVVIAVAALGALLIASSVVSFGLYRRAEKARAESVRAREQAETNAATANKVTSFLTGLFDHADPAETRGAELTARNLVDLGARRVREDLGGEPAVQSRVMQTIGEVYNSLGLPESAEALLVDAVDTAKKAHGDVHPEVASALRAYGDHLTDLSRFAEAQVVYNEALAILEELYGHDSIRLAPLINRIAESSPDLSPDEKIRMLQRSRGIVESQRSAEDPLVAYYLVNLARAYREKGEYDNALPLLQRAIAIRDAALEPDDPAIAQSLGAMAALLTAMQRYEEAIPHAERSLRILSKVYGPTSIQVTPSMNTLGKIRFELGQYAEARDLFERCRVINRETFGPENMRVGFDHLGLGDVHLAMQETGIARSHYERALEIFRVCYGETHVTTAYAHAGLGRAAAAQGMHDKAIEEYEVAVRLRQANLTPDHPLLRQTLGDLALSLDALGRHAEAREVRARSRGADLRRP